MRPAAAASASATVDLPLAASPVTQTTRGRRARQAKRSATREQLERAGGPLVRGRAGELRGAQEVDLGADERAHRAEEGQQRFAARVAAGGAVAAQQGAGEVVVAAGDVHDQEGEVVADVGDAQVAVELDAVDRLDAVAEQDVLGAQVAVAVADEAGRRAARELGAEGGERGAAEAGELREPPGGRAGGGERGEGLLDDGREPVRAGVALDGCGGVEARDGGADGDEVGLGRLGRARAGRPASWTRRSGPSRPRTRPRADRAPAPRPDRPARAGTSATTLAVERPGRSGG